MSTEQQAKPAEKPAEKAAIAIIGDEVLSGKIQDMNSYWLARELYALGVSLERVVVLPDRIETIASVVSELSLQNDVVFTSGGVGPTHDDLTYEGVAQAFAVKLIRHPELVSRMERHYRGELNAERLKMADVPQPDELCCLEGMVTPVVRIRNVYILPGVPVLFRQLFGAMRERFRLRSVFMGQIFTAQPEGDIAADLNQVVASHPKVRIGSYPRLDKAPHKVRLVIESFEQEAAQAAMGQLLQLLDPAKVVDSQAALQVEPPGPE